MALEIYKRGQGANTRLWSAMGAGTLVAVGCWRLYATLGVLDIANQNTLILVQTLVPTAVAVCGGLLVFWLINKPSVADFMISAEGEIKKVSWSSRKELYTSTFVVIFVVVFLACLLAVADIIFLFIFQKLGLFS